MDWVTLTTTEWAAMEPADWETLGVGSEQAGFYVVERIHVFTPGAALQHAVADPAYRPSNE